MKFSDQLEQRFATMVTHYPTKRSVLVPMLLYIQDELGALTDEAIHEIAERTGTFGPGSAQRHQLLLDAAHASDRQVQLAGLHQCELPVARRRRIFEHCKKKLGVGKKQSTPDGLFHLEEVECIGACSWAPALMMNYEFHENLTPEKIDELIDGMKKKEQQ